MEEGYYVLKYVIESGYHKQNEWLPEPPKISDIRLAALRVGQANKAITEMAIPTENAYVWQYFLFHVYRVAGLVELSRRHIFFGDVPMQRVLVCFSLAVVHCMQKGFRANDVAPIAVSSAVELPGRMPSFSRQEWSEEDGRALEGYVKDYGEKNWVAIANFFPGRTSDSLRNRYKRTRQASSS